MSVNPDHVYSILKPEAPALPFILDSPHSGRIYPVDFNYSCPQAALERAEDNEVDLLFESAPRYGATLLCALFPRTYIDVNRAADDIDTELLAERWPAPLNPSSRSYAGIGLIRRLVKPGQPVYNRALGVVEIRQRLDRYYHPYHAQLKTLLDAAHYDFGQVWHINCHSMPAIKLPVPHGILNLQPDFVLGDRDGTSCHPDFTHMIRDNLRDMGYRVALNNPYKGVEIVRRSAHPAGGRHSIQMEISKSLYWDENKNRRSNNFNAMKDNLEKLVSGCADYISSNLVSMAAD
ncbi:MAG: N-formylglutamate amidohydrolase [Micavibrio sp.]